MNALEIAGDRPAPATALSARLLRADRATHPAPLWPMLRHIALPLFAVVVLVALWTAWAPLSGAIVAPGRVQAEFGRKVVQHQEGGLLRELRVKPGQAVRRGDVLMVVADLRSDAAADLLRRQRDAQRLRIARAGAQLALHPSVAWPAHLHDGAGEAPQREQQLFDTRRRLLDERIAAARLQASQARSRVLALSQQAAAAERSAELARSELGVYRELAAEGFMAKVRLLGLERSAADAQGRAAAAHGQTAEARAQVASLEDAAAQAISEYRQQAADELRQATLRLEEIDEQLRPSIDQVERQAVRAPVDGIVMALRVSAVGTAIGPREPLLEIAPQAEALVVDTLVEPHDVDHVRAGGRAEVRLLAFESRSTPLLQARVLTVSPDVQDDTPDRVPRYRARVEVSREELRRLPSLRLQAGMPVEVFIATAPRTLLEYLAAPLTGFARRAMREP